VSAPFALAAPLILASASPRRVDLLTAAGFEFTRRPADIDETPRAGEVPERPDAYVLRVALDKALAVHAAHPDSVVLAADTTVTVDGLILGKPADAAEATRFLERLAGRDHSVLTAVVVIGPTQLAAPGETPRIESEVVRSIVTFRALTPADIARYVATGEPMGKAGAYAIQGIGASLVASVAGSYTGVIGLPVPETLALLAKVRVPQNK